MHGARLIATVWLPFACGYFLSYGFRNVNAVISGDLARDIGANPSQLGLLTAAYFLAIALAQLPLGILLDRYGPRRVEASLLLVAALGAALFGISESLTGLVFGRALIGLGVSACLMASIKAFVEWFAPSRLATLNGWLLAVGGLGAMAASAPVEALLQLTGWRALFIAMAWVTVAVALLIFLIVPDRSDSGARESMRESLAGLKEVLRNAFFWKLSMMFAFVQGSFMSVQGLWAAPWLRDVAGYADAGIGSFLFGLALAMTIGFVFFGNLSDRLGRRGVDTLLVSNIAIGVSIVLFALMAGGVTTGAAAIWMAHTFFATGGVLAYAILSREFPHRLTGRVATAINLLTFSGAFAVQWGIGAVINLWTPAQGRYPVEAYQTAFAIPLALQCIAFAVLVASPRKPAPAGAERPAPSP